MSRIIIKVGTKVINTENKKLDYGVVQDIVNQIVTLKGLGHEVILISSGAMAVGREKLKIEDSEEIMEKQVYAAVGQASLVSIYSHMFAEHDINVAQILVTKEDFRDTVHLENINRCLNGLFSDNIVPIVNENDVVAIDELMFTDNDELTSIIANLVKAEKVFLLTNVNGVVAGDINDNSSLVIKNISLSEIDKYKKHITSEKSNLGRGGMQTKFEMAKKMVQAGSEVYLFNGKEKEGVLRIISGEELGTTFTK